MTKPGENDVSKLRFKISISLDGFVAGPSQSLDNPLGIGGGRLHKWAFPLAAFRGLMGLENGPYQRGTLLTRTASQTDTQMDVKQPLIDDALVRRLVTTQFPQWADLPVRPVAPGGWDNRTFRLGEHMIARLPSARAYSMQVEKEHQWLPMLAPSLPLSIPAPLAIGEPADGYYPWRWSIYRWIEGDTAAPERIANLRDFATSLAQFLIALQRIEPTGGPPPGPHNLHHGGRSRPTTPRHGRRWLP